MRRSLFKVPSLFLRHISMPALWWAAVALGVAPGATAQTEIIEPNGPQQMPLIYVHGFNDDGSAWATDGGAYWEQIEGLNVDPVIALENQEFTYVMQWLDTDPNATSAEGFARLITLDNILSDADGANYNSPNPLDLQDALEATFGPIADCIAMIDPLNPLTWYPECESTNLLANFANSGRVSNYNRNGRIEHHARDMVDLFRDEFSSNGRFGNIRQVNIITHSAGGLDTRALLHMLNQSGSHLERERVANAVYNAPPFGGSSVAEVGRIFWDGPVDLADLANPWVVNSVYNTNLDGLLVAFMYFDQSINDPVREWYLDLQQSSYYPGAFTFSEQFVTLVGNPVSVQLFSGAFEQVKPVFTHFTGIPGDPKQALDLNPPGGAEHLAKYQENPHTLQYVAWGTGDPANLNIFPDLPLEGNYDRITDFGELSKLPGDVCVAANSSRVLLDGLPGPVANPGGYMRAIGEYSGLTHFTIMDPTTDLFRQWTRRLLAPLTSMRLDGFSFKIGGEDSRFYLVRSDTDFIFEIEEQAFKDHQGEFTVDANAVEYRVVIRDAQNQPVVGDWLLTGDGFVQGFDGLEAASGFNLGMERWFCVEWRSVALSQEHIRSAAFLIDDTPPSPVDIQIFDIQDTEGGEIHKRSPAVAGGEAERSALLASCEDNPNLAAILANPESDWVIKDPFAKFLRVEFDMAASVVFEWDNPSLSNATKQSTINNAFAIELGEYISDPGYHTLYYRAEDQVGNQSAIQAISFVVDQEPPCAALNYQPNHPLGLMVGPATRLVFETQDVETMGATGTMQIPGYTGGEIGPKQIFVMGQTNLAAQGTAAGVTASFVTLTAHCADLVGNEVGQEFEVFYDWTPPEVTLQYIGLTDGVSPATRLANGNYRITTDTMRVELRARDNASGVEPPGWHSVQPGLGFYYAGGGFELEQTGGRPLAWAGEVPLATGLNLITFRVADAVGNPTNLTFGVELVDKVIAPENGAPLELISARDPSVADEVSSVGSVGDVQVSDDAAVMVFESGRLDLVDTELTNELDVFAWNNGTIHLVSANARGERGDDRSFNPAVSGNGRYVYFASEASNLVTSPTVTQGNVNLYMKDLTTGQVALINRDKDGNAADLAAGFAGTTAYQKMAATSSGRYLFFNDRFNNYIDGDTNTNHDIYCIDLDPDVNGDLFDENYVIRRVSVGPGGVEGAGGLISTGGSLRPTCSADGLTIAFDTSHTNLFAGDTNGDTRDAVAARFAGIDEDGTIDFSSVQIAPLNVYQDGPNAGQLAPLGGSRPYIDRGGMRASFITAQNLTDGDTNNEGVDNDAYSSFELAGGLADRLQVYFSQNGTTGRIANNHTPSIAVLPLGASVRAYVADQPGLTTPNGTAGIHDLIVFDIPNGYRRLNWEAPDVPSTQDVIDGGVSPDGRWAWWVGTEEYSATIGSGGGFDVYRRRIDDDPEESIVVSEPGGRKTGSWGLKANGARGPKLPVMAGESGTTLTYQVALASQPHREVRVGVKAHPADEVAVEPPVLVFDAGNWDTPQSFEARTLDDAIHDGDVEVAIEVIGLSDDSLFDNKLGSEIVIVNQDDDPAPTLGLTSTTLTLTEGPPVGNLVVELQGTTSSLTAMAAFTITAGSATQGEDYLTTGGMVILPPGVRQTVLPIELIDDLLLEDAETLTVTLSGFENATPGAVIQATVNIEDNDGLANLLPLMIDRVLGRGAFTPEAESALDLNGDGTVDVADIARLINISAE